MAYRQDNYQARNELFQGSQPQGTQPARYGDQYSDLTNEQLVSKALETHKDSTAAAQRALRNVQDANQIQADTLVELGHQRQQLNDINNKVTKLNEDLTYGEKVLRYMRRCCLCWMCDSCTGADPARERRRDWEKQVDKGVTSAQDRVELKTGPGGAKQAGGQHGSTSAPGLNIRGGGPNINLGNGFSQEEAALKEESRKQDELLEQIHQGLAQVKDGAKKLGRELEEQNQLADGLGGRVEATVGRVHNVNTKSQLRKF